MTLRLHAAQALLLGPERGNFSIPTPKPWRSADGAAGESILSTKSQSPPMTDI
ncbi:hypothetical protein HA464_37340 (plasmid) [Rhizobium leguminosarum bv. trifolii]|jgi:hypothetical protein|uniref:hypothetical protein n=1 Tax=Rhizobium TaxID=379 RepID=UPI0003FEC2E5|nr:MULTISPECIES: hypothetical protein [Rhizobium]QIO49546.1 hypothetical protein HA464_37340 [Rhizobium leguminosarum bv. trifolii]QJS32604.1 hypothetical protein RLTA1_36015 [Rhizobium leguminosarum bv. trifolii TA1]MDI5930152.1 hypothetical protein [Rhizobium leguminosarum]UFW98930.1 hypothetical protein RlegTA1_36045 [Rhizobium ruizarguesonis]WSH03915.1 hypothetical protein U8P71_27455 [Rhizobium ruizarguesonis]